MIYLDNAATTPMDPRVIEVVRNSMEKDFANSGTVYKIGLDARRNIEKAMAMIATALHIPATHRLIFTSGGSESNNLFIKGFCFPDKKTACLGLEHPSVTSTLDYFRGSGNIPVSLSAFQVEGRLGVESVSVLKENDVRLLCLSQVNNELGTVNDPQIISAALKAKSPKTRLFLDGVQAVGKLKISPELWKAVSGYSISAHKINGPKGIGLLVYDSRIDLTPQIHGGKQQFGVRSGTLPVPLILGLAEAIRLSVEHLEETQSHLIKLKNCLVDGLRTLSDKSSNLNIRFNSIVDADQRTQSPSIVNFSFAPVEGEVLLHHLEQSEIFVGLGSACSAQSREPSRILTGIGLSAEEARCSLRISFGRQNALSDVERFLEEFSRVYNSLFSTFRKNKS